MKKLIINLFLLVLFFFLAMNFMRKKVIDFTWNQNTTTPQTINLEEIVGNPTKFAEDTLTVLGVVSNGYFIQGLGGGYFLETNETHRIFVLSNAVPPNEDEMLTLVAVVKLPLYLPKGHQALYLKEIKRIEKENNDPLIL